MINRLLDISVNYSSGVTKGKQEMANHQKAKMDYILILPPLRKIVSHLPVEINRLRNTSFKTLELSEAKDLSQI